jgi:hypothetical protein
MKNNWKKTIDQINAERFVVPPGWDTKDQVALSLECTPDKVNDMLKPGIASGDIERKEFSVWNSARRLTEKIVCYRLVTLEPPKETTEDKIRRAIMANPSKSNSDIARCYRGLIAADVAKVRASLKP